MSFHQELHANWYLALVATSDAGNMTQDNTQRKPIIDIAKLFVECCNI
jgi:hypothetical protein